jgi:hypothetical protein
MEEDKLNELVFEEINQTANDVFYDYPLMDIDAKEMIKSIDIEIPFKPILKKSLNIFETLRNIWVNPKNNMNLLSIMKMKALVSLEWKPNIYRYAYWTLFDKKLDDDKIFISKILIFVIHIELKMKL